MLKIIILNLSVLLLMKRSKVFKQVNDHTTQLYDRVTKIETEIISKISTLKKNKNKNNFLCEHLELSPDCPEYDPKIDYYDLFWKTFLLNEVKRSKIEVCNQQCAKLTHSVEWIQKKFKKYEQLVSYRNGIAACYSGSKDGERFMCKMEGCGKTYQSLGALDLHHKIKHESDRSESSQSSLMQIINDKNKNKKEKR